MSPQRTAHETRLLVEQHGADDAHVARCTCPWRSPFYINTKDPETARSYAERDASEHVAFYAALVDVVPTQKEASRG